MFSKRTLQRAAVVLAALSAVPLTAVLTPGQVLAQDGSRSVGSVSRLLEEGVTLMRAGKLNEALNRFNTVLVLEPRNGDAHYRIGQVHLRRGETEKGISFIRKATELEPRNIRIGLNLASVYERIGRLDDAVAEYKRLIATGSRDRRVKQAEKKLSLVSGKNLAKKGELNAALLVFNGLLLEYPDDPEVLFNMGATYILLNRVEEAERTFSKLVEKQPKNILAHFNLANIYERTGRPERALEHLKAIVDIDAPGRITTAARKKYSIIQGRQYFAAQEWQRALAQFQSVLEIDPKDTESLFHIGLANVQLGNPNAAQGAFDRVLEINPNDFSARLNLGNLYFDTQQFEKAREQFQYVVDNDEGRYQEQAARRLNFLHAALAEKALESGEIEESIREFEAALEYVADDAMSLLRRGYLLLNQKRFDEAKKAFEDVVALQPQNTRARGALATAYEQLGELTLAAKQYERIIELNPNSPEGQLAQQKWRITKARGLMNDRKLSEAQAIFADIVDEHPDNLEANLFLGIILESKGQNRGAAKAYQRLLEYQPNNHRVKMLLGKAYERLELEELAADEYRTIIFEGTDEVVLGEAKDRLAAVEDRLSGFANNVGYSFGFDSNVTLRDEDPAAELRSELSFDVLYGLKVNDRLRFDFNYRPVYTSYHVGQFDLLNTHTSLSARTGGPDRSWSVEFVRQELSGLLTEESVSNTNTLSVVRGMRLFTPAIFGLAPSGLEGEDITTGSSVTASVRLLETYNNTPVQSIFPSLGVSASQALRGGIAGQAGITVRLRRNLEENQIYDTRVINQDLAGNEVVRRILLFDSQDYEFNQISANVSVNKVLSPGVSGALSGTAALSDYINVDSSQRVAGKTGRRKNLDLMLSAQLSYRFLKDISFFGRANLQYVYSTLPIETTANLSSEDQVRSFQSTSLGGYTRYTVSGGVTMNF